MPGTNFAPMETGFIYHITTEAEWHEAILKGEYIASSLATEGFIHCATQQQVSGVLERYYQNKTSLLKLTIEVNKLLNPPKYEIATSIYEMFPHIFGPINIDAVIAVEKIN